jgi:hypothetical protein
MTSEGKGGFLRWMSEQAHTHTNGTNEIVNEKENCFHYPLCLIVSHFLCCYCCCSSPLLSLSLPKAHTKTKGKRIRESSSSMASLAFE